MTAGVGVVAVRTGGPGRTLTGTGLERAVAVLTGARPAGPDGRSAGGSPPGQGAGALCRGRRHSALLLAVAALRARLLGPGLGEPRRSPDPRRAVCPASRHRRPGRCTRHGLGGVDGGERGRQVGGREPASTSVVSGSSTPTSLTPVEFGGSATFRVAVAFRPNGKQLGRSAVNQWIPEGRPRSRPQPDPSCTTFLAALLSRRQLGGLPSGQPRVEYSLDFSRDGTRIAASGPPVGTGRERRWSPRGRGRRSGTWPARRSRSSA